MLKHPQPRLSVMYSFVGNSSHFPDGGGPKYMEGRIEHQLNPDQIGAAWQQYQRTM